MDQSWSSSNYSHLGESQLVHIGHFKMINFQFQGKEYKIDRIKVEGSPYFLEQEAKLLGNQNELSDDNNLVVEIPKWVNNAVFEIFLDFLNFQNLVYWADKQKIISDNTLQRLLWIADYFQLEKLQEKCINDLIIPRINIKNCLLFLNEAFKKLRACEDSRDVWYSLLNVSINFTSKNLVQVHEERKEEVIKINGKILEEIIERSLKYYRKQNDPLKLVNIFLQSKNFNTLFDLLLYRRKAILNKKINYDSHPSIGWKLSRLTRLISKETNPFKFNEFFWRLIAKNEGGAKTVIYLRNEGRISAVQGSPSLLKIHSGLEESESDYKKQNNETKFERVMAVEELEDSNKKNNSIGPGRGRSLSPNKIYAESSDEVKDTGFGDIVTMYYLIKLNNEKISSEVKLGICNISIDPKMILHEFSPGDLEKLAEKTSKDETSEFTVYLNTDYLYSAILYNISVEFDLFYKSQMINHLRPNDLICIFHALPKEAPRSSELSLICACRWVLHGNSNLDRECTDLFKNINLEKLKYEIIIKSLSLKKIREIIEIKAILEKYARNLEKLLTTNQITEARLTENILKNIEQFLPDDFQPPYEQHLDIPFMLPITDADKEFRSPENSLKRSSLSVDLSQNKLLSSPFSIDSQSSVPQVVVMGGSSQNSYGNMWHFNSPISVDKNNTSDETNGSQFRGASPRLLFTNTGDANLKNNTKPDILETASANNSAAKITAANISKLPLNNTKIIEISSPFKKLSTTEMTPRIFKPEDEVLSERMNTSIVYDSECDLPQNKLEKIRSSKVVRNMRIRDSSVGELTSPRYEMRNSEKSDIHQSTKPFDKGGALTVIGRHSSDTINGPRASENQAETTEKHSQLQEEKQGRKNAIFEKIHIKNFISIHANWIKSELSFV